MFRPRIIPVLLLKNQGLVKSIRFSKEKYIGDPINAVRLFNDLTVDELCFLDIEASVQGGRISKELVKEIGEEANMPFAVGGGIKTLEDIQEIIAAGAEKVILNTVAIQHPDFVNQASETFGTSTIVVCMDVKRVGFPKKQRVVTKRGKKNTGFKPVEYAKEMAKRGAGEIIVQSVDADGKMQGYDKELIKSISEAVEIPVVALGGAGAYSDLEDAYKNLYASGVAAGSLFVYHGQNRGVLINYPEMSKLNFL